MQKQASYCGKHSQPHDLIHYFMEKNVLIFFQLESLHGGPLIIVF